MKNLHTLSIAFALSLSVATPMIFTGCSTTDIPMQTSEDGAPTTKKGSLAATIQKPISEVQKAVNKALKNDLKFVVVTAQEDTLFGQYEALTALDEKILIRLQSETDKSTRIDIRVGVLGDEYLSWQILNAINNRL